MELEERKSLSKVRYNHALKAEVAEQTKNTEYFLEKVRVYLDKQ